MTGPKTDDWLVKTVGVLVAVIGMTLLDGARRPRVTREVAVLGAASAAGLAMIDVIYAARGTIRPIYLGDAVDQTALVALWVTTWAGRPRADA